MGDVLIPPHHCSLACGHLFCQDDLWNWFHRVNDDEDGYDSYDSYDSEDSDDDESDRPRGDGAAGPGLATTAPARPSTGNATDLLPVDDDYDTDSSDSVQVLNARPRNELRTTAGRRGVPGGNSTRNPPVPQRRSNQTAVRPDALSVATRTTQLLAASAPASTSTATNAASTSAVPARITRSATSASNHSTVNAATTNPTANGRPAQASVDNDTSIAGAPGRSAGNTSGQPANPPHPRRIAALPRPNRLNLQCPQCRTKVRMPPFPIFAVKDAVDAIRTHKAARGESVEPTRHDDVISDVTWGGIFPRTAS